jgi:hypothetical protein
MSRTNSLRPTPVQPTWMRWLGARASRFFTRIVIDWKYPGIVFVLLAVIYCL